jgi:hypothetical protein
MANMNPIADEHEAFAVMESLFQDVWDGVAPDSVITDLDTAANSIEGFHGESMRQTYNRFRFEKVMELFLSAYLQDDGDDKMLLEHNIEMRDLTAFYEIVSAKWEADGLPVDE